MSSIAKEEEHDPCGKEEVTDKNITCIDDDINNLHITRTEDVDVCASCGKEGSDLNICNKCKAVKYCNAACKKKHRTKHKKKCERRVADLHDTELFKQPPQKEDCPICMLPLPTLHTGHKYYACCGKKVCSGCVYAPIYDNLGNIIGTGKNKCPFCRTPTPTSDKEMIEMYKKRVEASDAHAMFNLGYFYSEGVFGLPQDNSKALELYHRAGELGNAGAYHNIGTVYYDGRGVERDNTKADHYYELAAMRGNVSARYNLGCDEVRAGNWDRAVKHWLISAGDGHNNSVKGIQLLYKEGYATKEDYSKALQAYQSYLDEIKSKQRDAAAAANDEYKYFM